MPEEIVEPVRNEIIVKKEIFKDLFDQDRALILAIQELTKAINMIRVKL